MNNSQRVAIALLASTLCLGPAAAPAFAADPMHGDAMHMKKHKGMMKKSMTHKDPMKKDDEPAQ